MNSHNNDSKESGFPIRKSSDQSLLATPRSLSQRATSFIASQCQGIHYTPFSYFIELSNFFYTQNIKKFKIEVFNILNIHIHNVKKQLLRQVGGGGRDRTDDL